MKLKSNGILLLLLLWLVIFILPLYLAVGIVTVLLFAGGKRHWISLRVCKPYAFTMIDAAIKTDYAAWCLSNVGEFVILNCSVGLTAAGDNSTHLAAMWPYVPIIAGFHKHQQSVGRTRMNVYR